MHQSHGSYMGIYPCDSHGFTRTAGLFPHTCALAIKASRSCTWPMLAVDASEIRLSWLTSWGWYPLGNSHIPKTNSKFAPENGPKRPKRKRERIEKHPCSGDMLVSGRVTYPHPKALLKMMIFLFPVGGIYVSLLEGSFIQSLSRYWQGHVQGGCVWFLPSTVL